VKNLLDYPVRKPKSCLERPPKNPHLKVMEAFMYRHHPQWIKAKGKLAATKGNCEIKQYNLPFIL